MSNPRYWLGKFAALTDNGIRQMIERRCTDAGIPHIHLHQFATPSRTTGWREAVREQTDAPLQAGVPREMVGPCAASAADERACDARRRMSPGDRL
ncbi:hypothetical protein [Jatrophihabitans endophyticus]|uniref:hypothetical protein n=1 Tax=Jatrophihabitans endophyticus TaxID=1206085 RepID=UPI0011610E35|nr:hypothetical protein [Jatrophihabitans endophyticus]